MFEKPSLNKIQDVTRYIFPPMNVLRIFQKRFKNVQICLYFVFIISIYRHTTVKHIHRNFQNQKTKAGCS